LYAKAWNGYAARFCRGRLRSQACFTEAQLKTIVGYFEFGRLKRLARAAAGGWAEVPKPS
jgi:hypothetical protein